MYSNSTSESESEWKKFTKRESEEDDAEISRKPKKMIKRQHSPGTSYSLQNDSDYGKNYPSSSMEITDSEDHLQKPKEKLKKKKKIKGQNHEVVTRQESSVNDGKVESKLSSKKRKKKQNKKQNEIINPSASATYESVCQSVEKLKKKKKKRRESMGSSQNEDKTDEQYSDRGIEDKNETVNSMKPKKGKKKQKKSAPALLKSLVAGYEDLFGKNDHWADGKDDSLVKSPKKLKIGNDNFQGASRSSKKSPKKKQEPMPSTSTYEEFIEQEEEVPGTPVKVAKKSSSRKDARNGIKPSADSGESADESDQSSPKNSPVKKERRSANSCGVDNAERGGIPDDQLVSVGKKYKLKRKKEKNCKNCNEVVKVKFKVYVRDLGIQTDTCESDLEEAEEPPISPSRVDAEDEVPVEDQMPLTQRRGDFSDDDGSDLPKDNKILTQ